MNAVYYERYGPSDVLRVATLPDPRPRAGEILIRICAAEVTKSDCELRSFRLPVLWFWLPLRLALGVFRPRKRVLGNYFAGEVLETGPEVRKFQRGDRIFGCTGFKLGAHAEFLCLSEAQAIAPMPENLTYAEAASIPLGGLNALHFLRRANIQPGEKVLINGAGGSIGMFAVQLAKHMGAEVTAVDARHKESFLRALGADHFIDHQTTDFSQTGQTFDVVFSTVASSSYAKCFRILNAGGRYLIANPRFSDLVRSNFQSKAALRRSIAAFAKETREELHALKALFEAGSIRPVVDRTYSLTQCAEAHRRVETEQRLGAVVFSMVADAVGGKAQPIWSPGSAR